MIRRLGRRWKSLHRLVYLIVALAILHYLWLVKADYLESGIYAIIAAILLLHRLEPIKMARRTITGNALPIVAIGAATDPQDGIMKLLVTGAAGFIGIRARLGLVPSRRRCHRHR